MEDKFEAIKKLAIKYGINLKAHKDNISDKDIEFNHLRKSIIDILKVHCYRVRDFEIKLNLPTEKACFGDADATNDLELLGFISVLSKALDNNTSIEVSTTIKGIKENTILTSGSENLRLMWLLANTLLAKNVEMLRGLDIELSDCPLDMELFHCLEKFKWKPKKHCKEEGLEKFLEPYTKEELAIITEFEKIDQKHEITNGKGRMRIAVNNIREYFRDQGVFSNKVKELTNKEYCFLYDMLAANGLFPEENLDESKFSASDKKGALRDYIREKKK